MPLGRDLFLAMSTNAAMRAFVTRFPLSRRLVRRFVAGETLDEAIQVVRKLNGQGLQVTLDLLGESVTDQAEARRACQGYLTALDAITTNQVSSHVSVKLTQMGLDLDPELCVANVRAIVERARQIGSFVRIDMEDSPRTQATIDVFKRLRSEYDNIGIVIQSYLYRSEADMRMLCDLGASVRLCKGAYREPGEVAFPAKRDVDENYVRLARLYLEANGDRPPRLALATHDEKMIEWAKQFTTTHHVDRSRFEFQMLYGIRPDLQRRLAAEGYTMRIYVPFGSHWYPYFMRRLAERPANVIFLVSNLFKGPA